LLARSATYPDGHFLAWTPGQAAPLLPKGLAWKLEPTTDLVVELHLQPSGKAERVRPAIGLFFGSDPPERVPGMIRLGRQNIDIQPGDANYLVIDSFTLPVDSQVLAVQPHAHYLAREVRGTAVLPNGQVRPLITIADWDFRWQQVYRYVTPLVLPSGTTLRMEYRYDNSAANARNPQRPPGRVVWGQRSADEMGDLWIQVLTRSNGELDRLMTALKPKVIAEDIIGYQARLAAEPPAARAALHDDLALLFLESGAPDRALEQFEQALALRPESAVSHFNVGTALVFAGREAEAVTAFEEAIRRRPDYALALNNLGGLLLRRGDLAGAAPYLERAARNDPGNGDAQQNFALLLRAAGQRVAARERFQLAATAYAAAQDWARAATAIEYALPFAEEPLASELRAQLQRYRSRQ
jgi:Flp pilus assembly protein TadD